MTIYTSIKSIGNYAFCSCEGLKSTTMPDKVNSIDNLVFVDSKHIIVCYKGNVED